METIEKHDIRDLDALIDTFPPAMKRNPLLVYKSKALNPELATFETPRMIFFNRDASLMMSIAKNPGEDSIRKGQDVLEVVAFDKNTAKFELYTEVFDGKRKPFSKPDKNPAACVECHGANPRPIFHDYNAWPGLYGSFGTQGVAATGSAESAGLSAFLKGYKSLPRYQKLDLSGFYPYPMKDKKDREGNLIAAAGAAGTGYRVQDIDGPFQSLLESFYFTPHIVLGMEMESLMHKRLAMTLASRTDFDTTVLPLLYYLGDETGEFEVVASRCGHPGDRTKKVYEEISLAAETNAETLKNAISRIESQILADATARLAEVTASNLLLPAIDPRGIASIPFTAFFPTPINRSPDGETHRKMAALIEVLFQKFGLESSDLSTSHKTPTTGIFHLSRLGRMAVDEQYFQNFMRGLKWAVPNKLKTLEQLSCEDVQTLALSSVKKLFGDTPVSLRRDGLMYLATQ